MELYLVQHAEAMSEQQDPNRPLTEVAAFVKRLNINVKAIWHSDKLRAEQTARELAKVVRSEKGLEKTGGLAPNDDVGPMKDSLARLEDNLMIVGHLPYGLDVFIIASKKDIEKIEKRNCSISSGFPPHPTLSPLGRG